MRSVRIRIHMENTDGSGPISLEISNCRRGQIYLKWLSVTAWICCPSALEPCWIWKTDIRKMQLVFLTTVVEPSLSFVGYGTRLLKSEQASDSSWNSAGLINLLYIRYYNDFLADQQDRLGEQMLNAMLFLWSNLEWTEDETEFLNSCNFMKFFLEPEPITFFPQEPEPITITNRLQHNCATL